MPPVIERRYVGYLAHPHFGVAEMPVGILLELDKGVPVIVLGSQLPHTHALVQVTFNGEPAAIYVPWDKLTLAGEREFQMDDRSDGIPFDWAR